MVIQYKDIVSSLYCHCGDDGVKTRHSAMITRDNFQNIEIDIPYLTCVCELWDVYWEIKLWFMLDAFVIVHINP